MTKAIEGEISRLEDDILGLNEQCTKLDKQYEQNNNQLLYLNSQIDGLENQLKQRKLEGERKKLEKMEQENQVYLKCKEQTDVRMRKTFQNYFQFQLNKFYLNANKSNVKMDVQTVAVFFLENPHQYVSGQWQDQTKEFKDGFSIPYKCATFVIKKYTTIQNIFKQAVLFWQLNEYEYTMADFQFNNVELLYSFFAENFFATHKEQQSQAYFYIWRKEKYTNFLLDEQKKLLVLPNKAQQQEGGNETGQMQQIIEKEMEDFIDVVPGLKLYKEATQEENQQESGQISVGWKIILLILSATYTLLIFFSSYGQYNYYDTALIRQSLMNLLFQGKSVSSVNDFYQKIENISFIQKGENNETFIVFNYIQIAGNFTIFHARSGLYDCSQVDKLVYGNATVCYYSIYSDLNANRSDIQLPDGTVPEWGKYIDKSQNQISGFTSSLGSYEGSFYLTEYFHDEYNIDEMEYQRLNTTMLDKIQDKLLGAKFNVYDENRGLFFPTYFYFEIAPSYQYIMQILMINYRVNGVDNERTQQLNQMEFAMMALSLILNLILIFISIKETHNGIIKEFKFFSCKRDIFKYIKFSLLYNLTILILQFVTFSLMYGGPMDNKEVFNDSSQNLMAYAQNYYLAMSLRGAMIIMLALNTLRLFEISSSVALMQAMAIKGAESIMMITLFVFVLLASFSFFFYLILYETHPNFNSYYRSFISTTSMFLFGNSALWDVSVQTDPSTTIICTVFMFMIFSYGALVLVNSVLQETYRTISYKKDYMKTIDEFWAEVDKLRDKIMSYFRKNK